MPAAWVDADSGGGQDGAHETGRIIARTWTGEGRLKNLEQPPLWDDDGIDAMEQMSAQLDRARDAWVAVRRRHEIGSDEEKVAWFLYRAASDRMWARVHD